MKRCRSTFAFQSRSVSSSLSVPEALAAVEAHARRGTAWFSYQLK
jgi:hypothetical protein